MHKFDPSNKSKLDNEWRREVLPPFKVLESLGLENKYIIADIGCGIGYFTIPAAELTAPNKVYALDISGDMLAEASRILVTGGKLAVVDWEKVEMKYGPPVDHRICSEEVNRLLNESGFDVIKELDFKGIFYGITAVKK